MTVRQLEALGRRYEWLQVQRSANGQWTIRDSGSFASKTLAIGRTLSEAIDKASGKKGGES